jgi:hypothetical protein
VLGAAEVVKKKEGRWRLAAQYRSPGYSGNLASLQCQLGCLQSLGTHLPAHVHVVASRCTYRAAGCPASHYKGAVASLVEPSPVLTHFMVTPRCVTSLPTASKMP